FGGTCRVMHYDARRPASDQFKTLEGYPSTLYYFATGSIFRRKSRVFVGAIYEDFVDVYLRGFFDLCSTLNQPMRALTAFYPSSIYVQERPAEMTEYAMAKAAGEVLCQDMMRFLPNLRVLSMRLPRMATDQTLSVLPGDIANSIEVL